LITTLPSSLEGRIQKYFAPMTWLFPYPVLSTRMGIPVKANIDSGGKANGIPE
jgi:hypothetical protein